MTNSKFSRISSIRRNAPAAAQNEPTNVIIKDVKLFWSKLNKPVDPFGTLQYEIQIQVPKKREKELAQYGKTKAQEGGMVSLNLKKKAEKADGTPAAKVRVVDASKQPLDSKLIGNGSTGNVMLMLKDYQIKGPSGKVTKEGTSVMLTAVQVTDLIKYVPKKSENFVDFDEEESDTPAPKAKTKAKPSSKFDDMDDDIPF